MSLVFRCFFFLSLFLIQVAACAQSTGTKTSKPATRHDDWRRIAIPALPPPNDPAELQILKERGDVFDSFSITGVPLDQPQPARAGGSSRSIGNRTELPFFDNEAIVVATFDSYQPYLTLTRLATYTDVKLSVEQVLAPGPTQILPGQLADLLIDGGCIKLENGKTINDVRYDDFGIYSIQPGHRYVLVLQHHAKGQFFTSEKDWELVEGVAVPEAIDDVARVREGNAKYSGLSERTFLDAIRGELSKHQN